MVTKIQSETTYEVNYKDKDYILTVFQDLMSGIVEYDVYDMETVEDCDGDLELEVIRYFEENLLD